MTVLILLSRVVALLLTLPQFYISENNNQPWDEVKKRKRFQDQKKKLVQGEGERERESQEAKQFRTVT